MITDGTMAALCVAVYGSGPAVQWDYFQSAATDDGVCFGIKQYGDEFAVVFRGSATAQDWYRDFDAFAWPITHSKLGSRHKVDRRAEAPRQINRRANTGARCRYLRNRVCRDGGPGASE